jgi:hypothetical protein
VLRNAKKKMTPTMINRSASNIKHGIAPWRGIAEVLELLDFFLIFGAAIQMVTRKRQTSRACHRSLKSQASASGLLLE